MTHSLKPMPWTTAKIIEATNGELLSGETDCIFSGVSIDSRKILPSELFIAIKGDVHDGHGFVKDVIKQGVRGIIISKDKAGDLFRSEWQKKGIVCVTVNNTTGSLGDLAAFIRKHLHVLVVAITGSNGKTTTKDMTAGVISRRFCTLSTSGNFNNEIGVPLTLLRLNRSHQWAVLELGMNHPGEIARLSEICKPDIGVITNIGPAHLEGLGSIEGVMHAKGELLEKIKSNGTAILNGDDPRILSLSKKTLRKVFLFGLSKNADVRAHSIKEKGAETFFTLALPGESVSVNLKAPGLFMVSNALAAAAVGHLAGLSAREIKSGLENFKPAGGRMNIVKTNRGFVVVDDTYNANPVSMEAAITTFKSLKGDKKGALVAGDMLELGKQSESMHKKIGLLSARSKIARLYATGNFAEAVTAGAKSEGLDNGDTFTGLPDEILDDLINWIGPKDWVLVKGSRSMGMEKIVKGLIDWGNS